MSGTGTPVTDGPSAACTPASPASAPLTTKAASTRRPTGMPESRAASGSLPMPYSSRPLR